MKIAQRFVAIAVMGAVFLLIVGVADVFVDTSRVRDLIYHSAMFWAIFAAIAWFIAPMILRFFPMNRSEVNDQSDV